MWTSSLSSKVRTGQSIHPILRRTWKTRIRYLVTIITSQKEKEDEMKPQIPIQYESILLATSFIGNSMDSIFLPIWQEILLCKLQRTYLVINPSTGAGLLYYAMTQPLKTQCSGSYGFDLSLTSTTSIDQCEEEDWHCHLGFLRRIMALSSWTRG